MANEKSDVKGNNTAIEKLFVVIGFMLVALGVYSATALFHSSAIMLDLSSLISSPYRQDSIDGEGTEKYSYHMGDDVIKDDWYNHTDAINSFANTVDYPQTSFSEKYPDASDWVNASWQDAEKHPIIVIFTDNPDRNCGLRTVAEDASLDGVVAGCYNPQYGRTIYIFWGKDTNVADREYVLSHEYSHFITHFIYFDTMQEAYKNNYWSQESSSEAMEQDAECRLKNVWGWETSSQFSSYCSTEDWYEGWIVEEIQNYTSSKVS